MQKYWCILCMFVLCTLKYTSYNTYWRNIALMDISIKLLNIVSILITYLGSYSPEKWLLSVVSYDKKSITNKRTNWSDYGVSIISKWGLNNGPVLELCWRVNIQIKYLLMAADVFYSEYLSCLFTMSEKAITETRWVPYSNMITCQMILDNDDEFAQAMADIIWTY